MTKKTARAPRTQAKNEAGLAPRHLVEPMLAGMTTTRQHLLAWVHAHGLAALDELFREEAVALAGPKGRPHPQRTHHHWGTAATELTFGGRRVQVRRPRVRPTRGGEATLPSVAAFRDRDPADRADDAAAAGRGVDARLRRQSGGPAERAGHPGHEQERRQSDGGAADPAAAHEHLTRRLEGLAVVALFMDGVVVAQ